MSASDPIADSPVELASPLTEQVAQVLVDTGLAHLDRPFDYLVPAHLEALATPGVRVKVPFAGRDRAGFVVSRRPPTDAGRRLATMRTVLSDEVVLTERVLQAAQLVAAQQAGAVMDVLRLAIPPRHARAERGVRRAPAGPPPALASATAWDAYEAGPALLLRLRAGQTPWGAWLATPAPTQPLADWPVAMAQAVHATALAGRGSLVVVPDAADLARVDAALKLSFGSSNHHLCLTAAQGPQARYTAWLRALRGEVNIVVGTRAAAWVPVANLGLVAWWDDGDDLHQEPRSPYPHTRQVLRIRAGVESSALLVGGYAISAELMAWIEQGVLPLIAAGSLASQRLPRRQVAGQSRLPGDQAAQRAQVPSDAWRIAKEALTRGPVLVQVPRRGYLPSLACRRCRMPARCLTCAGPLGLDSSENAPPTCRWCRSPANRWSCAHCGSAQVRSSVTGARRTAEELGRAFPGVPVKTSGADEVLTQVDDQPALVIATPGAEPLAATGYAAVLLLDAWALLERSSVDASLEALRRWLRAAALARPAASGGQVILAGAPSHDSLPAVEAFVRWAPTWLAERELSDRNALRLPPTVWSAQISGEKAAVAAAASQVPTGIEVTGPAPSGEVLLRAPWSLAEDATGWLRERRRLHSAHKKPGTFTVRVGAQL